MTRGGAAVIAVGTALTAALLNACTVPGTAVAGVGVSADGSPVGYLQVCSHSIDGATLYVTEPNSVGEWEVSPSMNAFSSWSLPSGGSGWRVTEPMTTLQPGTEYILYGWTHDNSASADAVHFTTDDLAAMHPGQVRYWAGEESEGADVAVTTSVADFKAHACDIFE